MAILALVLGILIYEEFKTEELQEGIPCDSEVPSIDCVYFHHELYYSRKVSLNGTFASYSYNPSGGWGKEAFEDPKQMSATIYLTVNIKDQHTGTVIEAHLGTSSEIHVDIINHVLSLKEGDPVSVTGRPGSTCIQHIRWCTSVGNIDIDEINGLSKSSFVKFWELSEEERKPWYLGEGLKEGIVLRYNLSTTHLLPVRAEPIHRDITLEFHRNDEVAEEWMVTISALDGTSDRESYFTCLFDRLNGTLNCPMALMPPELKDDLDSSIFFLGRQARLKEPQPLSPIMSRWPNIDGFDYLNNRMFVFYDGNVTAGNEFHNATAVGWNSYKTPIGYVPVTLFWIVDDYPLPLKAMVHRYQPNANYERNYNFELIQSSVPIS